MYKLKNATLLLLLVQTPRQFATHRGFSSHLGPAEVRSVLSTVLSDTTPERLPGGVFKQPGVTQRAAAEVPRVEISPTAPVPHVQPMPGPSSRTVLGMHLVLQST